MKTKAFLISIIFLAILSCSRDSSNPPSELLGNVYGLASAKQGDDLSMFYTSDTVRAEKRFAAKNGGTMILAGLDRKIFVKGSKFEIVEQKSSGGEAAVKIRIVSHPSPNMNGFETTLSLKREDGQWKIDRADEIKSMLK